MTEVQWEFKGREFINCNCAYGCPCQFNALPTDGTCRAVVRVSGVGSGWRWCIEAAVSSLLSVPLPWSDALQAQRCPPPPYSSRPLPRHQLASL